MDGDHAQIGARVGDWLEAHGMHGGGVRRGQIVEILGGPGRWHFQVRWNEHHESIVFPNDGVRIVPEQAAE